MKKLVFCVYDKVTNIYEDVHLAESYEVAFGSYRRTFREMYIKDYATKDAMRDLIIYGVGYFDTKTGVMESLPRESWLEINVLGLVSDLSESEVNHAFSN